MAGDWPVRVLVNRPSTQPTLERQHKLYVGWVERVPNDNPACFYASETHLHGKPLPCVGLKGRPL